MSDFQKIKNGSRYTENGWIRMTIKGNPYDMGYANGYLLAAELKEIFRILDFVSMNDFGLPRSFFTDVFPTLFRHQVQEGYPEYYEEMKGITAGANARGTRVTLDDIFFWNCYYSVGYMMGYLPKLIDENPDLKQKYGDIFPDDGSVASGVGEGGARERCSGFIAVGNYTKDGKIRTHF